jgi:glycosyltransferase involved in cell wall biosynthesis
MNILYLAAEPRIELASISGHTTHIRKTIKGLEEQGHAVHRIIAGERAPAQRAKKTFRALKYRMPRALSLLLRDVYALVHDRNFFRHCQSMCRRQKFDFIYERATPYHRTGQRLSASLQIPLILEMNSPLEEMITLYGCSRVMVPIAAHVERGSASRAHAIIVGSRAMRNYLAEQGTNPDKIHIIYPTADDHFFRAPLHQAEIRRQWQLQNKLVVGFVGSMAAYHRVDLLLHAAIRMRQISARIHFLIVGAGETSDALQRFARGNSLRDYVSFTGRVPYEQIPDYYAAMDICIIPHAEWYGSPTKLFEYAASGKPVIAPAVGPIEEIIRHGENGLLFQPLELDDLTSKILDLANNALLCQKLGSQLKRHIFEHYTLSQTTTQLINILNSLTLN